MEELTNTEILLKKILLEKFLFNLIEIKEIEGANNVSHKSTE